MKNKLFINFVIFTLIFLSSNLRAETIFFDSKNIKIEGGDIILYNDYIFIGLTGSNHNYKVSRTSRNSIDFLKDVFPKKNIIEMD